MAPKRKHECFGLRTRGDWSAADLALLARSVDTIYSGLLSADICRRIRRDYAKAFFVYLKRLGPYSPRSARELQLMLDLGPESFGELWFDLARPPPFGSSIPSIDDIFRQINLYSKEPETLRVHRLSMSSSGGISFQGIGEIVEQLRGLVKDIWYRNKQEKAKGQLELLGDYLSLRKEHSDIDIPVPPQLQKAGYTIKSVNQAVENVQLLEREGKLLAPAENLDYEPPDEAA